MQVRYCLHCGERTGTLVKWHATQTCTQFLEEALASRETAERRKLAAQADAGCDLFPVLQCVLLACVFRLRIGDHQNA